MNNDKSTDRAIELALDDARGSEIPEVAERLQKITSYAQRIGYYEMIDKLSHRAIAEGRSFPELIEEAQLARELPTHFELEARMLAEEGKLN